MTASAFPLEWPQGWPRTSRRASTHNFGGHIYGLSFDRARRQLFEELARLGAKSVVLSTNVPLRNDGVPYASAADRILDDPGVAVYFTLKGRQFAMARDGFVHIAANMRSLSLAIEGLRQLERHGGSHMMDLAFSGFTALPPPPTCWQVLGIPPRSDDGVIRAAFKTLAMQSGSSGNVDMDQLARARDTALKEITQ